MAKPKPDPEVEEEELPDDRFDDRNDFNLGDGGRWIRPEPHEDE